MWDISSALTEVYEQHFFSPAGKTQSVSSKWFGFCSVCRKKKVSPCTITQIVSVEEKAEEGSAIISREFQSVTSLASSWIPSAGSPKTLLSEFLLLPMVQCIIHRPQISALIPINWNGRLRGRLHVCGIYSKSICYTGPKVSALSSGGTCFTKEADADRK